MNLNKRFFGIIAAIAVLAFAFAIAASGSDGGVIDQNAEGVTVAASSVTTSSINYQGRLTDSAGEPLSGSYTMTFRLYEVASGGSVLDTDTHSVVVTDGLFNTEIDFDPEYFDGKGLWLGITVGIDSEMSPRQELRPVPYALSLKPGANIVGASSVALLAESTHTAGSGIRGDASATSGTNYGVVGESKSPDGYGGYFYNNEGGTGVYGKGTPGGYFTTDQGGTFENPTEGVNVTTVHDYSGGVHASTSGDNSYGVYVDTTGDDSLGVVAGTTGDNSLGVVASTTGDDSYGFFAQTMGENSYGIMASTHGENSDGVWARSDKHYGVYGEGKYGGYFTTNQGGTSWADRTAGVDVATTHDYSYGVQAHTAGDNSNGVAASTSGGNSHGVSASTTGDNSNGVSAYTAGNHSNGIWAYSDKHYGVYGKGGKYGGYFTTDQGGTSWDDKTAGVNATTAYDYSSGVQAHTTGDYSTGVNAVTSGDHSLGVQASTTGENSPGVDAYTTGDDSDGFSASAWGENSVGVRAYSVKDYGVYGKGKSGGYFTTNQDGTILDHYAGVSATTVYMYCDAIRAETTGDSSDGVYASTTGKFSDGVNAETTGNGSDGVHAYTSGVSSFGVRAETTGDSSDGVYASTHGDSSDGVHAYTYGDDSPGVYAYSTKSHGVVGVSRDDSSAGVVAKNWNGNLIEAYDTSAIPDDRRFYVSISGHVYADGSFHSGGADVAEYFPITEDPEPCTVMVIGEDSKLQISTTAYDTTVAGIVSTAPGVALGTKDDGNEGEKLIAVAGRVPCKVDATYAPIEPGDLLTTSDTPGHAMKATAPQIGTILGKALEPLDSGTDVIEVLVTLQ